MLLQLAIAALALTPSRGTVGAVTVSPADRTPDTVVAGDNDYKIALIGDIHGDYDKRVLGTDTAALAVNTAFFSNRMNADAMLALGDYTGDRSVDTDGDGDVDCTVDRFQDSTCAFPSPYTRTLLTNAMDAATGRPIWALDGNHDGHQAIPTIDSLALPNQWRYDTFDPLGQRGIFEPGAWSTPDHWEVRIALQDKTWSILSLSDTSWRQDRAKGGRCDLRDNPSDYTKCSTRAWPTGVVTAEQLQWLDAAITRAHADGNAIMIATHQPPSHTVVLTAAAGDAYAEVCAGVRVHAASSATHFPRDADVLPGRTDLDTVVADGKTPLGIAHDWASALIFWDGSEPDLDWAIDLLADHPGEVALWVSAHNHVPTPDLTYNGRGMRWNDPVSGTAFLAIGAATRGWCTTSGACPQMGALLTITDTGWTLERWALQIGAFSFACSSSATIPGTRPAKFGGIADETGALP